MDYIRPDYFVFQSTVARRTIFAQQSCYFLRSIDHFTSNLFSEESKWFLSTPDQHRVVGWIFSSTRSLVCFGANSLCAVRESRASTLS